MQSTRPGPGREAHLIETAAKSVPARAGWRLDPDTDVARWLRRWNYLGIPFGYSEI
jgi:hypothetical protein